MRKRAASGSLTPDPSPDGRGGIEASSAGEIADRWGLLKRRAGKIGDEIEALKGEFERRGLLSARGEKFSVVKGVRGFASLDVKAIRAEMGAEWCAEREKAGERVTYEVNAVPKG